VYGMSCLVPNNCPLFIHLPCVKQTSHLPSLLCLHMQTIHVSDLMNELRAKPNQVSANT
jgi:hypothetical protein